MPTGQTCIEAAGSKGVCSLRDSWARIFTAAYFVENGIEDTTGRLPEERHGAYRLNGSPFLVGEFAAHDSSPQFRCLNHGARAERNAPRWLGLSGLRLLWAEADISNRQSPPKPTKMTQGGLPLKRTATASATSEAGRETHHVTAFPINILRRSLSSC
jgi:hypothetical protein